VLGELQLRARPLGGCAQALVGITVFQISD